MTDDFQVVPGYRCIWHDPQNRPIFKIWACEPTEKMNTIVVQFSDGSYVELTPEDFATELDLML